MGKWKASFFPSLAMGVPIRAFRAPAVFRPFRPPLFAGDVSREPGALRFFPHGLLPPPLATTSLFLFITTGFLANPSPLLSFSLSFLVHTSPGGSVFLKNVMKIFFSRLTFPSLHSPPFIFSRTVRLRCSCSLSTDEAPLFLVFSSYSFLF